MLLIILVQNMTSPPINLYHTQMVIVEGCPFIYYYDFSPPPLPFKYFLNEGLASIHVL